MLLALIFIMRFKMSNNQKQNKHTELSTLTDACINLEDITKYFDIKDIINTDDLAHPDHLSDDDLAQPDHPVRSYEEVEKAKQQLLGTQIKYTILTMPPEGVSITGFFYDDSYEILEFV